MSRTPVLQFTQVAYGYTPHSEVLTDVSFSLASEEVVALLGGTGAGKTTLIQLAMGMLVPQRGSIRAFGLDPLRDPLEVKSRIGYVAEEPFPPDITVGQVVRITEPDLRPADCDNCALAESCGLKSMMHDAMRAFLAELDQHTLETAAAGTRVPLAVPA